MGIIIFVLVKKTNVAIYVNYPLTDEQTIFKKPKSLLLSIDTILGILTKSKYKQTNKNLEAVGESISLLFVLCLLYTFQS